jgi:hypothetical protein
VARWDATGYQVCANGFVTWPYGVAAGGGVCDAVFAPVAKMNNMRLLTVNIS